MKKARADHGGTMHFRNIGDRWRPGQVLTFKTSVMAASSKPNHLWCSYRNPQLLVSQELGWIASRKRATEDYRRVPARKVSQKSDFITHDGHDHIKASSEGRTCSCNPQHHATALPWRLQWCDAVSVLIRAMRSRS